jgi:hypothetical protein
MGVLKPSIKVLVNPREYRKPMQRFFMRPLAAGISITKMRSPDQTRLR